MTGVEVSERSELLTAVGDGVCVRVCVRVGVGEVVCGDARRLKENKRRKRKEACRMAMQCSWLKQRQRQRHRATAPFEALLERGAQCAVARGARQAFLFNIGELE